MSECSHLDNCGNLVGYTEFLAKCQGRNPRFKREQAPCWNNSQRETDTEKHPKNWNKIPKCPECETELVVPEDKYLGHFVCPNSECSCLKEKPAIEIEPTEKDETAIKRARNILKPLFEEKQKGETTL